MARRTRIVGTTAMRAAALYAVWLLIDDNVSQPELFVGIGVALLALVLATIVKRSSTVNSRVRPRMLRYLYRAPLLLIADSFRVCWTLFKTLLRISPAQGRFRAVRYDACGEDGTDVARRALTEWGASIAPNRYVIGVDRSAGTLLVHELVPTHGPLDPLELG